MKCKDSKKYIYQTLDGEVPDEAKASLTTHLEECSACQAEYKSIKAFQGSLKAGVSQIEPSADFERIFWQKVLERQREPWFAKLLKDLESLIPVFNPKQAIGFVLLAFFIGNMGGVASVIGPGAYVASPPASIQHFSSLQEFKGVPSNSLAAAYLKTPEAEISE